MDEVVTVQRVPPELPAVPGLRVVARVARFILRGAAPAQDAAGQAFGLHLPREACRAARTGEHAGERAALWLGPDEWLLLAPEEAGAALGNAIAAALSALPHSLVDVSHRQIGLELSGSHAATLLAAGCPLDLYADAFPAGMCTRTMLGKSEITLWRVAPDTFRLEVWRSFAAYVCGFLAESARGI
jgi:sarcosine oxidase, subunit gamma